MELPGNSVQDFLSKDEPYPVEFQFALPLETVLNFSILVVLVLLFYFTLKSRF